MNNSIYILLIQSSVSGHLGCSHLLTVVDNAAVNTQVQASESLLAVPLGS